MVTVTQDGKYLSVSTESLTFDPDGGSKTVTVTTDGAFTTSTDVTWLIVTTSNSSITVKSTENTSTLSRTGKVSVSLIGLSEGSLSRTINVQQSAKSDVTFDDYGDLKPLD